MDITKEQARQILTRYITIHGMPIYDVIVIEYDSDLIAKKTDSYTFRYLLSIAYDLKELN